MIPKKTDSAMLASLDETKTFTYEKAKSVTVRPHLVLQLQ